MRKILVLTHGHLASGAKNNSEIILGKNERAYYIDGYIDGLSPQEEVDAYFAALAPEDEVIVFTDFLAGSTTQLVAPYITRGRVHILTGFNMPMLLEALCSSDDGEGEAFLSELIQNSRNSIIYVNERLVQGH